MNGVAKLRNLRFVSCSDLFDWEMSHSFFTPGAKLSLKEICKAPRLCGKWSNFFGRPWRCLQMKAETAWTLKSSFVGAMPIENRPPLSLYQNLLRIFFYVVSTNHIFERGHWIAKLPEIMENEFALVLLFTSITFHSSASQKISSNPTILHRLEWRHIPRFVSCFPLRYSLQRRVWLHVSC